VAEGAFKYDMMRLIKGIGVSMVIMLIVPLYEIPEESEL
jgi:hypothetical protein